MRKISDIVQLILSNGYPSDPFTVPQSTECLAAPNRILTQIDFGEIDAEGNVVNVADRLGTEDQGAG